MAGPFAGCQESQGRSSPVFFAALFLLGLAERTVLAAVGKGRRAVRMGGAKLLEPHIEPQGRERFFPRAAEPFGRVLAVLAGAKQQAAVPADIGFPANIAAANGGGHGGATRLQGNQVVEFNGVGNLQPVFAESAEIAARFARQDNVSDFEDRFTGESGVGKPAGGFARLPIVPALALLLKGGRVEPVNGKNDLADVPARSLPV